MKWSDLKNKNTEELKELLAENRAELHGLKFQAHGRQLKQVHKVSKVRKTITRLVLLLKQRQMEKKA